MILKKFFQLYFIVIFLFFNNVSFAKISKPSFDCSKAKSPNEIAICNNDELATLDKKVNDAFIDLKAHPEGRIKSSVQDLVKDQKKWLHDRDHDPQSGNVEWLKSTYKTRLLQLTFPGAPIDLSDKNFIDLETYFLANGCDGFAAINKFDLRVEDGLQKFGVKLYETNPKLAKKLFTYGSSCDWYPFIEMKDTAINKVPALSEYIDHLDQLRARDRANPRLETEDMVVALNDCDCSLDEVKKDIEFDPHPDYKKLMKKEDTDPYFKHKYYDYPALLYYSWQGLWEQDQYKKHLKLREAAMQGLVNYYIQIKHASPEKAKQSALYHVMNIADTYIGSHYTRTNKIGLKDLDDFLQTASLPDSHFPCWESYYFGGKEVKEELNVACNLSYFLKLAIVNNYSKQDIIKIINAGAEVKGSAQADDTLMNSVRRPDILELLINKGANVNAQNSFGKTPLMYAIQFGNLEAVKILLNHHADINAKTILENREGYEEASQIKAGHRTPLMYAAWHANNEVIKYLLDHGADPNIKDTEGHDYKFYLQQNDFGKM